MSVNPDYERVNAEAQVSDPSSPYRFWGSVLGLRKKHLDVFVYGDWVSVDSPNEEVFAFTRQYENQKALVVCNWTPRDIEWNLSGNGIAGIKEVLLNNYDSLAEISQRLSSSKWSLRPYEAVVTLV